MKVLTIPPDPVDAEPTDIAWCEEDIDARGLRVVVFKEDELWNRKQRVRTAPYGVKIPVITKS